MHLLHITSRHLQKNTGGQRRDSRQMAHVIRALVQYKTWQRMKGWGERQKGVKVKSGGGGRKRCWFVPTVTQQVQPEPYANKDCDYKVLKKWRKRQTNRKKTKQGLLFGGNGFRKKSRLIGESFCCLWPCLYIYMSIWINLSSPRVYTNKPLLH